MDDRSSTPAPHARAGPRRRWCARSCTCAGSSGWARSRSPPGSGCAASTVHAVLRRCRLNRLSHVDRATGEPVRRYEHPHPGSMIHVDVKKLGNIPDGGGWRYVGRRPGRQEPGSRPPASPATATTTRRWAPRSCTPSSMTTPGSPTPRSTTTRPPRPPSAVLRRAVAWFAARGVTVERVLSDNGSRLHSLTPVARRLRRARHHPETDPALPAADQRQDRTLPPHHGRRLGLPPPLHQRNASAEKPCQHGSTSTTTTGPTPPSAGQPPITRLTNLPGQYI